jgi:hypothetical protein
MSNTHELTTEQIEQVCSSSMRVGAMILHCLQNKESIQQLLKGKGISDVAVDQLELDDPAFLFRLFNRQVVEEAHRAAEVISVNIIESFLEASGSPAHFFLLDKMREKECCWDIVNYYIKVQENFIGDFDADKEKIQAFGEQVRNDMKDNPELAEKMDRVQQAVSERFGENASDCKDRKQFMEFVKETMEKEFGENEREYFSEVIKKTLKDDDQLIN